MSTKLFPMKKAKSDAPKKNKGGRPQKVAILAAGKEAEARFAAGLQHVLKAGPHPHGNEK